MTSPAIKKLYAKQRASTAATRKVYAQDRMSDFKYTSNVVDAALKNLMSAGGKLRGGLTAQQAKQMTALETMRARNQAAQGGAVDRIGNTVSRLYGSATAGAITPEIRRAEGLAEGSIITQAGTVRAGEQVQKGGSQVMDILMGGVAEAGAAAKYQTAEALKYRAQEDAKLIAEQQFALKQARLDAQLQFATWKKQQDYLAKQEEEAAGGMAGLKQVVNSATEAASWMRTYRAENPDKTVQDLVTDYQTEFGNLGEGETQFLMQVARMVKQSTDDDGMTVHGYTRADEANDLQSVIRTLYPNFRPAKLGDALSAGLDKSYGTAGTSSTAALQAELSSLAERVATKDGATAGTTLSGAKYYYNDKGVPVYYSSDDHPGINNPVPASDLPETRMAELQRQLSS